MDKGHTKQLCEMTDADLRAERDRHQAWVDSPSNDGRLTSDSSAYLDYCFDSIEEIEAELKLRCK